jgi:Survival motor neuron (SMN) interacting protein 1 (SIP1)
MAGREYIYGDKDDELDDLRGPRMFDVVVNSPEVAGSDDSSEYSSDEDDVSEKDDENIAATRYLAAVAREVKEGPSAVVANSPVKDPQPAKKAKDAAIVEELAKRRDYAHILVDNAGLAKKLDFFWRLREDCIYQIENASVPRRTQTVNFSNELMSTAVLMTLDEVSIVTAVEAIATLSFSNPNIAEWLFALLVVLQVPLLEDTAAALQRIRKSCESLDGEVYLVLATVIANVFDQK